MLTVKYLICPGVVKSQYDGELHHVSGMELMMLYKVNPLECKVVDSKESARGLDWKKYIVLRPRFDGNYVITE